MSNPIHSLLDRVAKTDSATAEELRRHIDALGKRREFGLNFEKHIPEQVPLVGRSITVGDRVCFIPPRSKTEVESHDAWVVESINGSGVDRVAELHHADTGEKATRLVDSLVYVADIRDSIYPGLKSTGKVERGGEKPFHTVVNAENYHALEALMFTHQGTVDAIYIDPPYNTGDPDWKYNNDYVDKNDEYRHSKWLSFMERRLKMAKKLLNPGDSVLIVTIDEKEYLRLGLLLEQTFPGWKMQMISSVINPRGMVRGNEFARSNEFIFFVWTPGARIQPAGASDTQGTPVAWETMRRRSLAGARGRKGKGACGPNQFFPIFVNKASGYIVGRGDPLPLDVKVEDVEAPEGCVAVLPARDEGTDMNWSLTDSAFDTRWAQGYVRAGKATPDKPQKYIIQYVLGGVIEDIGQGKAQVLGRNPDGSVNAVYVEDKSVMPHTQWDIASHNAQQHGTGLLRSFLPDRRFPYAKSLYAVEDALRFFVANKPNALIVDFFAGSGTTTHAVVRLNRQDNGRRRSIIVTNNEVSAEEQVVLRAKGLRPGDPGWEALGICDYITKPRIQAAITGKTLDGQPIDGDYRFVDEFPMVDGFEENVEFFNLTYENPALVELDMAYAEIAPLLWMRAGSQGRRINERTDTFDVADAYAVLFEVDAAADFLKAVDKTDGPRVLYVVTDDEPQYQAIATQVPVGVEVVRLYETYLRTFEINTGKE